MEADFNFAVNAYFINMPHYFLIFTQKMGVNKTILVGVDSQIFLRIEN
jgi:hypothetical protein